MSHVHPRTPLFFWLPLAAVALAGLFSGCGGDQRSTGGADLTVRALSFADVTQVTATVTGPALPAPRNVMLTARQQGSWGATLGNLPVGSNYVFAVSATSSTGSQLYNGAASAITIVKGHNTAVVIVAQQSAAPSPFKNGVPVIDTLLVSSTSITPGETVTVKATAHDPDAGDTIGFAWSTSPAVDGFASPSAATTSWTAPGSEGDVTLTIAVKDNHGATTSASLVVHVANGNGRGQATVHVSLNTWPVVTDLVVAPGFIVLGQPVSLTAVADDADNDPLTYAWTSTCASGVFSAPKSAATTFSLPSSASDTSCEFDVEVADDRGGSTSGQTLLPVGAPASLGAPSITASLQSAAVVDAGTTATFSVAATDPQGSALAFAWLVSAGALSGQADTASSSQVTWTAPATGSASFTVSVVVTDALGMSTQLDFTVKTAAITSACVAPASTAWKFGVISDTQWTGAPDDGQDPNSDAIGIINQVNAEFVAKGVKLVVAVGDITDNGSNIALQTSALFRQRLYNAGIGFFPLRGNHESSLTAVTEFKRLFPQTQTGLMNATPTDVFTALLGHVDDTLTSPVSPLGLTFTMGESFSSPSAGTTGLSYAFDYNNARFVLLDQFVSFDGTASSSGGNYLDPQLPWIGTTLAGKPAGGHAFVFGHKGLITENHVDTLFGADPSKDPTGQDTFINALASNGVRYYMGGHDHMHNRSMVTTTDGVTAKVEDIIGASDSSKFYFPPATTSNDQKYNLPAFGHTRQTQFAQELNTVGYYIFTVDGSNVSVEFYSAVVPVTLASGEYLMAVTPVLSFAKRETFGYGLSGQEFVVPEGSTYSSVTGSHNATTAAVLSGSNASIAKDASGRALNRQVDLAWSDATCATASAIMTLTGTADLGAAAGDSIVLSMTFDPSFVSDAALTSGSFGLVAQGATGNWVNAVSQNVGGATAFVLGAWNSSYTLGTYGIDPTTNSAWAVVNHAGRFAVAGF